MALRTDWRSPTGHFFTLEEAYDAARSEPGDLHEHIPMLRHLTSFHTAVVEIGTRYGVSTVALLAGKPKFLTCLDLTCDITISHFSKLAAEANCSFDFILGDSLQSHIPPCDMLFIDSLHTKKQLLGELLRFHKQVSRTIVMHDTEHFGIVGEDNGPGLKFAIDEFLVSFGDRWRMTAQYKNNNGLTILRRRDV